MTLSIRTIAAAAAMLAAAVAHCQVISSLTDTVTMPAQAADGIISDIEDGQLQDQFLDWSNTLGDFSDIATVTQQELLRRMEAKDVKKSSGKTVEYNGRRLNLPSAIDENGIDLYMLTDEGITIYMALLAPVFWQETDEDIKKWIRFYAWDNRSRTEKMFKRYFKWEDYIKDVFKKHGVPQEIAELCLVESACTYTARSKAGAVGMWQIMPATARQWGLTVSLDRDERTDPIRSTETAARILKNNHAMNRNWTLCIAGYNCGMGRIKKATSSKGSSDWPAVRPALPKETQQYIPSLLAIHYVWQYREKLGFDIH